MHKIIFILACCCLGAGVIAQTNINRVEYFIDNDPGFGLGAGIAVSPAPDLQNVNAAVSLNGVSTGIHTLFIRSRDGNGKWSLTNRFLFVLISPTAQAPNISKAEYFIDADPGFGNGTNVPVSPANDIANINAGISLTGISAGIHTLFIRSKDVNGKWSISNRFLFVLISSSATAPAINKAEFFFDTDPGFGNANNIPLTPGQDISNIPVAIPLNNVSDGIHTLFIRSRDANGRWSVSNRFLFVKLTANPTPNIIAAEYFIDDDPGFGKGSAIPLSPGADVPTITAGINMANIQEGLHKLFVRSKDGNGKWSVTNERLFVKIATDTPVTRIEYFFDTDPGFGAAVPIVINPAPDVANYASPVNITGLAAGAHKLFIRSSNGAGKWSITNKFDLTIGSLAATPFININSITAKDLCGDQSFRLSFHATGTYNNGNIFSVQLSDKAGSFAAPVTIGSVTTTASSIVTCTIPLHIANGNGYKVRMVSSSPVVTGIASDTTFTLFDQPRYSDTAIFVVCQQDKTSLLPVYNTSPYTLAWSTPTPASVPVGSYEMYTQNTAKCKDTAIIVVKQDVAVWKGSSSKNWHTAANWSTGRVPGEKTHVIIPAGTPNICELSAADVSVSSIQVKPGGTMQVINSRVVNIMANCSPLPQN